MYAMFLRELDPSFQSERHSALSVIFRKNTIYIKGRDVLNVCTIITSLAEKNENKILTPKIIFR